MSRLLLIPIFRLRIVQQQVRALLHARMSTSSLDRPQRYVRVFGLQARVNGRGRLDGTNVRYTPLAE